MASLPKFLAEKEFFKDKLNFLKEQKNAWLRIKAGYPFSENKKLDEDFFAFLEEVLAENSHPLEKRINALKTKKEQIEKLLEQELTTPKKVQESLNLFNDFFKNLQDSFLPQKDYLFYKEKIEKIKKEFIVKNQKSLEALKETRKKALMHKKIILEKITAINQKAISSKEANQEIKKLYQEWHDWGYIPRSIAPDLEINFKKNVNLFYKNLKKKFKEQKENLKNNFFIKKRILDRLSYLIDIDSSKKLSTNQEFNPNQLKDIWEYNRQFKNKKSKSEKKKAVFSLLKEWNNHLALDYQDRKNLSKRFAEIRKNLREKGYFS